MVRQGDKVADRYELIALLGEGGMGVVWRARDTRLERPVAVKMLSAATVGSETARERLIREARAAAALDHEGIVNVYDVSETSDGGAYLVMELIRGRSLRGALDDKTLGLGRRAQIIVSAARALAFAHASGIVHRDIKPDNIMIRDDGLVKVVDFGVAKPIAADALVNADGNAQTLPGVTAKSLTAAGHLVGTPSYLAPEQARGGAVTSATDQFALGVTAYEALTGDLPFAGDTVVEVIAAILRDEPTPIAPEAGVPPAAFDVLKRALAKAPGDRFATLDDFADAFAEATSSLPVDEPALPSGRRANHPTPARTTPPTTTPANKTPLTTASKAGEPALTPLVATSDAPAARSSSLERLAVAAAAITVLAGGAWLASKNTATTASSPDAAANAASGPDDVLACPAFEVTGLDEPWLGTAAAALACERHQLAHGGSDARTLVPAELADVQREISAVTTRMPADVDARKVAVEAAKKRATRWLDGTLDKLPRGYAVKLVLRTPAGAELAHGEGHGVELFEAVAEAFAPILRADRPATAAELATLQQWLDVPSADAALALTDIRTAILIEDLVSLKAACETATKRTDLPSRVTYLARVQCARKLRTGRIEEPPPAIDESTPGALITTTMAHGTLGGATAVRERAALLEKARDKTTLPEGQARLAAAAAELHHLIGDDKRRLLARAAVQASPKAVDWRMNGWHRLAFASDGDASLGMALAAWHPWQPVSHSLRAARGNLSDPVLIDEYMVRSYLLAQRGYYANQYGEHLVKRGKIEAARGVAEGTEDPLLAIDVMNGEAKYAAVLAAAPRMLRELPADDANAATAFRLASKAVRAALTLGKPADFVDIVVTKYVEAEPHHIVDGVVPFVSLISACSFAPPAIGKRCLSRIKQLQADKKLAGIFNGVEVVVDGAARHAEGDHAGAAKVLRTLLRAPTWVREPLFVDLMATVFDRVEAYDLADEVDTAVIALIDLPRTADLAWVRGAKRAQRRGDHARARKLAQAVLDKWRFADEDPAAMREMRDLLAKLPP